MKRAVVLFAVSVSAVAMAGCSGGSTSTKAATAVVADDSVKDGGGTPIAPSGSDPAKVAKATAAVMQPADFSPGFKAQPEEPGQGLSLETLWVQLTRCLGVDANAAPRAGIATSPTFKQSLATQGRSTVEYTTEPAATALAAALTGPKAQGCLNEAFAADLDRSKPQGATAGEVKVAPRDAAPLGQKALAWRVNATVHLDELIVPLYQDFVIVFDHGTVVRSLFLNPGSEFPQDLERSVLEKVVSRA